MNPFKPTAGKMPPELIGREAIVDSFLDGIENGPGAMERLMRISGARGMGKTVILNQLGRVARDRGWIVIDEIASKGFCERILDRLCARNAVDSVQISPSVFGISLGSVDVDRASPSLREAIAERLKTNKEGLLITLDEVQDANLDEVRALAVAIQQTISDDLSVAFVFAGLPSMIDRIVNAKTLTFLRRAVPEHLTALDDGDVRESFAETIAKSGLSVSDEALDLMVEASAGYPFMMQLVGYCTWQAAHKRGSDAIEIEDARAGEARARLQFDRTVIEPALQNLPPSLVYYAMAMAEDEGKPSRTGVVAKRLDKDLSELSSYRSRLLRENVIESKARGEVSFTIPYLDRYLNEHRAELLDEL